MLLAVTVKCDLHCFLHWHVSFWSEVSVEFVLLLFNRTSKLHQRVRDDLPCLFHYLLKLSSMALISRLEESVTDTTLSRATCPANSVNIIFNC